MGELKIGQKYEVKGPKGELHLRKEAAISDNIIDIMPNGSKVTLVSKKTKIKDNFRWYNIKHKNKTGWAVGKHLIEVVEIDHDYVGNAPAAPAPTIYSFKFDGKTRYITEENLKNALNGTIKYISKNEIKKIYGGIKITLDDKYQGENVYWVTQKNFETMDKNNLVT